MNYKETLQYIQTSTKFGIRLGLERITILLELMGNPQDNLKFIHVAGTNGKGSTCCVTSYILKEAGLNVGLFTSPFICTFNERIQFNNENISNEDLAEVTSFVKKYAEMLEDAPTEFELNTAIAFEYFKRKKCDIVVLEVGMGGEFDSTNVIKAPLVAALVSIGMDHVKELGPTLRDIARTKAKIIKAGCVAVAAFGEKVVEEEIVNRCKEQDVELFRPELEKIKVIKADLTGTVFEYEGIGRLETSLVGEYQLVNIAMAIRIIEALNGRLAAEKNLLFSCDNTVGELDEINTEQNFEKKTDEINTEKNLLFSCDNIPGELDETNAEQNPEKKADETNAEQNFEKKAAKINTEQNPGKKADETNTEQNPEKKADETNAEQKYKKRIETIGLHNIKAGIKNAKWIGRFQVLNKNNPTFIVDGAHNPHGMKAVIESLRKLAPDAKFTFVYGAMADKDIKEELDIFLPFAKKCFTVTPNNPRAMAAPELAKLINQWKISHSGEYLVKTECKENGKDSNAGENLGQTDQEENAKAPSVGEKGIFAENTDSVKEGVYAAWDYAKNIQHKKNTQEIIIAIGSLYMICDIIEAVENYYK